MQRNIVLVGSSPYSGCDDCYYFETNSCLANKPQCSLATIYKMIEQKEQPTALNKEDHNAISKPKHYMLFPEKNIEVRDMMQALADRLESNGYSAMFISDYIQMQQYLLRFDEKNGKEDLEKAKWYLNKLIESDNFDA